GLSEPQSTPANHEMISSISVILSPFTTHGPSRRLPLLVLALEGATSYGASAVANPPGHMSRRGASSTGNGTVAPGGSARLASLRQSNQAPARGTRRCHHRRCNQLMECPDAPAERLEQVPRRPGPR